MILRAPRNRLTVSWLVSGFTLGTAKDMSTAGTRKFMADGINSAKKVQKSTMPFCQTISVVISPKGENAPRAFAPTTMSMQVSVTKWLLEPPTASATAHMSSAWSGCLRWGI